MLKALKLLRLEKQQWQFPKSSCLDGLQTSHGNFHRQSGPHQGIFFTAFFTQRKMTSS